MRVYGAEYVDGALRIALDARDFMDIRSAARKCRVRVKIAEKHSARNTLRKSRSRFALPVAAVLSIAVCILMTRFIWLVEINGANAENIESIRKTLNEIGVKRGSLISSLPDGMTMKREILNGTDGVAWAWVYIDGVKARVEIYEKTLPPAVVDKSEPCDILAACDGVIEKMTVREGEALLKEGDAVSAGDVIVSGRVGTYREGYPEEYIYVHSIAEVRAHTVHSAEGYYKLYYESRTPTGRMKRHYTLDLFGKALSLPSGRVKFEEYDRSENRRELNIPFFGYSGIALDTVEYCEMAVNRESIPVETVLDAAKNDLEEKIAKELMPESVLTDESIEYEQTDDETIKVTLRMNFTENIAVSAPSEAR